MGKGKCVCYIITIKILFHIKSHNHWASLFRLTHWGRVTHICVTKLTIIGSDNGLSPDRRQAIIWTNAGILLIGPLGTNLIEILIEILIFSFKKMRLIVSSAKRRQFCLGLNGLNHGQKVSMFYSVILMIWQDSKLAQVTKATRGLYKNINQTSRLPVRSIHNSMVYELI